MRDKIGDAYAKLKAEYKSLHIMAQEYPEGRNVFLNVLSRETGMDKATIAHWLNNNTSIKYDLRRTKGFRDDK